MNAPQLEFAEDVKIVEAHGIKTERVSEVGFIKPGNRKKLQLTICFLRNKLDFPLSCY